MRQSATYVSSLSATHVGALDSKPPVARYAANDFRLKRVESPSGRA
jgi:hypothetical protein